MSSLTNVNDVLLACTIGDVDWLKRGLSMGINPNSRNKEGLTGLHLAAKNGKLDCIRYLLENNLIDVNDPVTSSGNTALHCMLSEYIGTKNIKCMRLLLDNGGDHNRHNKMGQAPLHFAARFGRAKCLKILLECGADMHSTDKEGRTVYDLACLHGQHECARLLRALHWANKKDIALDTKLKKDHLRRSQEQEYVALHARLQIEAAEYAYDDWLEQKNVSKAPSTPFACDERNYIRSRSSQRASTCASCTATATKQHSAVSKSPKVKAQIQVNHHQEKRNVDSVGKPPKLYPYTNYPPNHLRSSTGKLRDRRSKSRCSSKSGRSSRASVSRSEPILQTPSVPKTSENQVQKLSIQRQLSQAAGKECKLLSQNTQSEVVEAMEEAATTVTTLQGIEDTVEAENGMLNCRDYDGDTHRLSSALQGSQYDYCEDEDDDLLFHDVGHTNNLDALALPNSLTKDKTPAEVLQLLRSLGNSGSKSFRRSSSPISRRNSIQGGSYQRKLSLGAIPEGRLVTSYSDEEQSTSQLLDDTFVEELIKTFSNCHRSNSKPDDNKDKSRRIVWDIGNEDENDTVSDESFEKHDLTSGNVPTIELSSVDNQTKRKQLILPISDTMDSRSKTCYSPADRVEKPQTLKVVNFAWDPVSNSVHSKITASPLSPQPEFGQRQLSSRKLARSPSPLSISPVESSTQS